MQPIAVPAVLDIEEWLAEELPETGQLADLQWDHRVRWNVADDHLSEQFRDDEFDRTTVPEPHISPDSGNDLAI